MRTEAEIRRYRDALSFHLKREEHLGPNVLGKAQQDALTWVLGEIVPSYYEDFVDSVLMQTDLLRAHETN